MACLLREVKEELDLTLSRDNIDWVQTDQGMLDPDRLAVFMVGHISLLDYDSIVLGDEGQGYKLMPLAEFLSHDKVIPQLQKRLKDYLESKEIK